MMKAILVVVAVFLACVEAKTRNFFLGRQGMDQDVLEISKSNMIFKCQVAAVEDTPDTREYAHYIVTRDDDDDESPNTLEIMQNNMNFQCTLQAVGNPEGRFAFDPRPNFRFSFYPRP